MSAAWPMLAAAVRPAHFETISNPVIVITHAAFDPQRRQSLSDLLAQLHVEAPDIDYYIASDTDRKGSLWCWKEAMNIGLDIGASHIIWLPDDAIVCRRFGGCIRKAIAMRQHDVFDCYVNHSGYADAARRAEAGWYSTPDGYTGMGGVMPRELLREHLEWRDRVKLRDSFQNDGGVNLWAMETGRRIYKTACTLVQHRTDVPSLDGHDAAGGRTGAHFIDDEPRLSHRFADKPDAIHCGRTFKADHWNLVRELPPPWQIERMYDIERGGPIDAQPHVFMATPTYGEPAVVKMSTDGSRNRVADDLTTHGIAVSRYETAGESLISRVRQRTVHAFLKSSATHLLWWDCDIEAMDPTCVRAMIASGRDVIAGACPFKQPGGKVVCNPFPEDLARGEFEVENGCLEVQQVGSGFCLVSRKAIVKAIEAHPELMHFSLHALERGEPLWAIYETAIVNHVYLSEDYFFCYLWQKLGGAVHVYVPATFRHHGIHAFEGSFAEHYGLVAATP